MDLTNSTSIYSSLKNSKDIRLLRIDPKDTLENISCDLQPTNLDESPTYFALSYFWGGSEKPKHVKCNGTTLRTTENLYAAMKRLRATYQSQPLWIDAICINQDDLGERAIQVQIMCDIYRSAENVIVYLGEEMEGLDRAMELFQRLYQKSTEPISSTNTAAMIRGSLPGPSEEVWYRLHDFFNRPWFSRMWVVQEIAVASSDPVVLCGSFTLSWSHITKVAHFLRDTALTAAIQRRSLSGNAIMIEQFQKKKYSLGFMLTTSFHFESTDPRDRVFAFYGIVHPEGREMLSLPYFNVSYEKSVNDVYQDVMMGCIDLYGSVDFMFRGSSPLHQNEIQALPTWVPNWAIPPKYQTVPLASSSFLSGYKASGGHKAWKSSSGDRNVLRIAGKSYDEVVWVAEQFQKGDLELVPHARTRPQTLQRLWNEVSSRLGQSREVMEAFWRTLVANVDRDRAPTGPMSYNYFLKYWYHSKAHDDRAIRYKASNSGMLPKNEAEERALFEETTAEERNVVTEDEYEVFKRWCNKTAELNLPCRSHGPEDIAVEKQMAHKTYSTKPPDYTSLTSKCIHCHMLALPVVFVETGFWKVQGSSPALAYRDTDPFIADYYRHLENGGEAIIGDDDNMHIAAHMMNILGNRAFFITRSGSMGLGPWSTRVMDRVVILSGASVPALLRQSGDMKWRPDMTYDENPVLRCIGLYQVVGEAYIHGIMGGEAVNNFNWDKDYEVFDLL